MTASDTPDRLHRFERDLREALREEAGLERPDYLSDVLLRTVEARQRPAWTFPERWLPMSLVTSRAVPVPRIPWRVLAVAAVLIVLAAAAFVLFAGSRPRPPAPFGPAANGLVAYSDRGDIYTVDPSTGTVKPIVTGSDASDTQPVWSRDGTMLAFLRQAVTGVPDGRIIVSAADGSGQHAVTPALPGIPVYSFSPDGRQIAFTSDDGTGAALWIADVQQGVARKLDLGMNVDSWVAASWLPPNGGEMVIVGFPAGGAPGLYAVDPASGKVVRTIVAPKSNVGMGATAVSPDGSRVAYSAWDGTVQDRYSYRVHVVNIDGSNNHVLPMPPGATFEDAPVWSNDGTRLVTVRGYSTYNQQVALAVVPSDGSDVGVETTHDITGCCDNVTEWAPNDTSILFSPEDLSGNRTAQLLIDPSTGEATPASWAATSFPTWQRRAP